MTRNSDSASGAIDGAVFGESINGHVDEPIYSGVPFDLATSHRPGARFGPAAIRAASAKLAWQQGRWPWEFQAFDHLGLIVYQKP